MRWVLVELLPLLAAAAALGLGLGYLLWRWRRRRLPIESWRAITSELEEARARIDELEAEVTSLKNHRSRPDAEATPPAPERRDETSTSR